MQTTASCLRPALPALPACALLGSAVPALAERIVLQVSDGNVQTWNQTFNAIGNLRQAYGPGTEIEVVAFGQGINMLKFDAPVSSRLTDARKAAVVIYACENSMERNKLARNDMAPDVVYIEAGVKHLITRQREGWALIGP